MQSSLYVIESIYVIIRDTDHSYRPIRNQQCNLAPLGGDSHRSDLVDRGAWRLGESGDFVVALGE